VKNGIHMEIMLNCNRNRRRNIQKNTLLWIEVMGNHVGLEILDMS